MYNNQNIKTPRGNQFLRGVLYLAPLLGKILKDNFEFWFPHIIRYIVLNTGEQGIKKAYHK